MPILKFYKKNGEVVLEKLRMEDITKDKRTALLDHSAFINSKYRVDENVYMAKNDLFFRMAKVLNTSKTIIDAMLIQEEKNNIIIVPNKSYVFWNGRSIEPEPYTILQSEENIELQQKIEKGIY